MPKTSLSRSIPLEAGGCAPPASWQHARWWRVEAGLTVTSTLDPAVILAAHLMDWAVLGRRAPGRIAFRVFFLDSPGGLH